MAGHDPKLEIYRPVSGLTEDRFTTLRHYLEQVEEFERNAIRRLFTPSSRLKAHAVRQVELKAVHRHFDKEGLRGSVYDLAEYVRTLLSSTRPAEYRPDSLPAHVHHGGRKQTNLILSIGSAPEMIADRQAAKAALSRHYDDEPVPAAAWQADDFATEVQIAKSYNSGMAQMIVYTGKLLERDPDLLPPKITLGAIAEVPRL